MLYNDTSPFRWGPPYILRLANPLRVVLDAFLNARLGGAAARGSFSAAMLGVKLRLRAVMITSVAFILGLVPPVWADGASMTARHNISTPVLVGMIAASTLGIFLIPMLYVTFQTLRVKLKARVREDRNRASVRYRR